MTEDTKRLEKRESKLVAELERRKTPSQRQADFARRSDHERSVSIYTPSQRQAAAATRRA
ncbi:hypothetical protein DT073_13350 [Microbacterium sp. ABRD28]|nr:hypothetical protein DT073_13350 [Microbacterium sp. ABRD28]